MQVIDIKQNKITDTELTTRITNELLTKWNTDTLTLIDTAIPGFSRASDLDKVSLIKNFVKQYDPRSADIYAYGKILQSTSFVLGFIFLVLCIFYNSYVYVCSW